jgi:hypothetical protein
MSITSVCLILGDILTKSDVPSESLAGLVFMTTVVAGAAAYYAATNAASYLHSNFPALNFWRNENHNDNANPTLDTTLVFKR